MSEKAAAQQHCRRESMLVVGFVGPGLNGNVSRQRDVDVIARGPPIAGFVGRGAAAMGVRRCAALQDDAATGQPQAEMAPPAAAPGSDFFSCAGMSIQDFFLRSVGDWRSQRSSHNLAFAHFEEIMSDIQIEQVPLDHDDVVAICESNDVDPVTTCSSIRMTWEGSSDWDEDEVLKGTTLLVVVKDGENNGRLLRSMGYAETIPAVGQWTMQSDGTFVLLTPYESAAAEERIWFATPDMRVRVSMIRTSSGRGVITSSMSSEIRQLSKTS